MDSKIVVIIPAFNEENSVGKVVNDIPKDSVEEIIVVNNNSTDKTRAAAELAGAIVLDEPIKGYGNACLKGLDYVSNKDSNPEIIVFLDADYSDYPEQLNELVAPIIENNMDMVIGSRALGNRESGSMTIPQVFGNWLATRLIRLFYGYQFTDLGPFRAIKWEKLQDLAMSDKTFGWTVEMQVKAAKKGLKCTEVPMKYRNRIGKSKVSGTVYGTFMAGYKILYTIFKYI
ncbi:glycosyltransferase family 2 protein [Marivirga arenosa]|uniref:Glycosyltransferase family 2 protein n=1 Tax=Marivirga arenosa TaxID=3059076 RepID=A0AA51N4S5_9BACT|nr:glycosyltransferase family 2 protein [Marivirga sp. ABR2-2]WMN06296.1 glycosyltransferase family 2 protein [Marivirga sp. ABR2-2]